MTPRATTLATLLCLTLTASASAAGDEARHEIVIRKGHACEGDDCADVRKMIFVGDDGEVVRLSAGDHDWFHLAHRGAFLGVGLTELTPELRTHFGVPEDAGVMVSKIVDGSPAATAGVAVGDIITAVDGERVASAGQLARLIRARQAGAGVALEIWRDGRLDTLSATLEEGPATLSAGPHRKVVKIRCDEGEDCGFHGFDARVLDLDCGDEECEVRIECAGGDCTCTVNGETRDCDELER